jgi:acyl carrier protein
MNVKDIVAEVCEINVDTVSFDSGPKNIAAWDSMKHIEIIIMCESNFNISFSPTEIPLLTSVGKIKEIIDNKK